MKIFLAGMESIVRDDQTYPVRKGGNYLATYFYRNSVEHIFRNKFLDGTTFFLDSGAFSFLSQHGLTAAASAYGTKRKVLKDNEKEKIMEEHFQWISLNYSKITWFCELDLQNLVGMDLVQHYRKKFREAGISNKMIQVTHIGDSLSDFYQMLDTANSGYVACAGFSKRGIELPYKKLCQLAYEAGIRIHGFAMTGKKATLEYPFWSVDSSSWTMCYRFGELHLFDGTGMKKIPSARRKQLEEAISKYGFPPDVHPSKKDRKYRMGKLLHTENEWRKYETYLGNLWKKRGVDWATRLKDEREKRPEFFKGSPEVY